MEYFKETFMSDKMYMYYKLTSLLRFSSHCSEFAAITIGKDKVLPHTNDQIVSSSTVRKEWEVSLRSRRMKNAPDVREGDMY